MPLSRWFLEPSPVIFYIKTIPPQSSHYNHSATNHFVTKRSTTTVLPQPFHHNRSTTTAPPRQHGQASQLHQRGFGSPEHVGEEEGTPRPSNHIHLLQDQPFQLHWCVSPGIVLTKCNTLYSDTIKYKIFVYNTIRCS